MEKITIWLNDDEAKALKALAISERRHYRSEAAYLIHLELERRGFIKLDSITITEDPHALKIGEPHD